LALPVPDKRYILTIVNEACTINVLTIVIEP